MGHQRHTVMRRQSKATCLHRGLTLVEMTIAMAMMAILFTGWLLENAGVTSVTPDLALRVILLLGLGFVPHFGKPIAWEDDGETVVFPDPANPTKPIFIVASLFPEPAITNTNSHTQKNPTPYFLAWVRLPAAFARRHPRGKI